MLGGEEWAQSEVEADQEEEELRVWLMTIVVRWLNGLPQKSEKSKEKDCGVYILPINSVPPLACSKQMMPVDMNTTWAKP